jgi:hypothetical protein
MRRDKIIHNARAGIGETLAVLLFIDVAAGLVAVLAPDLHLCRYELRQGECAIEIQRCCKCPFARETAVCDERAEYRP